MCLEHVPISTAIVGSALQCYEVSCVNRSSKSLCCI